MGYFKRGDIMIEIKSLFGKWHKVKKEQAKDAILFRLPHIVGAHREKTFEYINHNILRGIKVEELLSDEEIGPASLNLIKGPTKEVE